MKTIYIFLLKLTMKTVYIEGTRKFPTLFKFFSVVFVVLSLENSLSSEYDEILQVFKKETTSLGLTP